MSRIIYFGVEDTDILGGPFGTGKVARGLAQRLVELGLGTSLGVSRHQLLVDPRIKYTSHNSAKGLAITSDKPIADFYEPSIAFMKATCMQGSDPGLCICEEDRVNDEIINWGKRTQSEVLTKQDAIKLALKSKVFLIELGGDGGGVIGALGAVGLRAGGNDGRLVDLPGINSIKGLISVADLLKRTGIVAVQDADGNALAKTEIIDSQDWVKPSLIGGQPVLRVQPTIDASGKRHWQLIEKRSHDKGED